MQCGAALPNVHLDGDWGKHAAEEPCERDRDCGGGCGVGGCLLELVHDQDVNEQFNELTVDHRRAASGHHNCECSPRDRDNGGPGDRDHHDDGDADHDHGTA